MTYTQLSPNERYQISALLAAGHSKKAISHQLGRHRSTIQREILRCRDLPSYDAAAAQERAVQSQKASRNAKTTSAHLLSHVEHYLRLALSPQQVMGRLEAEGIKAPSVETIYQHILKDQSTAGDLHRHLRCQKKRRKRYATGRERRGRIGVQLQLPYASLVQPEQNSRLSIVCPTKCLVAPPANALPDSVRYTIAWTYSTRVLVQLH